MFSCMSSELCLLRCTKTRWGGGQGAWVIETSSKGRNAIGCDKQAVQISLIHVVLSTVRYVRYEYCEKDDTII